MKEPMKTPSRPYIRAARAEDREAVFRFSQHTWEWGDYIPLVWERWLTEAEGKLLVTTVSGQPVALGHVVMAAPGEAFLEGLRVDPDYRQVGLATAMTRRLLGETSQLGVNVVRLATLASNTTMCRLAAHLGFRKVASFVFYQAETASGKGKAAVKASPKDLPRLLAFLKKSSGLSAIAGLYSTGWRFHRLSADQLRQRLERGMVRAITEKGSTTALAVLEPDFPGEGLAVSFADGRPDALTALALALRAEVSGSLSPKVSARLPELANIREAFVEAGYKPQMESPLWIFERAI
jgi:ribosomal protein S18 acetylase RimI-like enzyme